MPSRIDIGPDTGPFVELDEENGEFVIRVPEDEVNFDQSDLRNVKDFTAGSVSTDALTVAGDPSNDHWEQIGEPYVVTGAVVDFDRAVDDFDCYRLRFFHDSGGSSLKVRMNNDSSTTYNQTIVDDTGVSTSTGQTEILIADGQARQHGSLSFDPGERPTVSADVSTRSVTNRFLLRGCYGEFATLDSLQIFTDTETTETRIELFGRNID